MPPLRFAPNPLDERLEAGFRDIRDELDVPTSFPPDVLEQAEGAAARGPQLPPGAGGTDIVDRRDLPLVAIDPPGSRDLDQAFAAETRSAGGYRVHYAISDVAAFVTPGSALDDEALKRGVTLYSPDRRASLHPEALNEAAASLLPDVDRQVVLWTIDLDADGELEKAHLGRAMVRNRRAITYAEAQAEIDGDNPQPALALLKTIGTLRQQLERERGAISLQLPSQEITRVDDGYRLHFDVSLPTDGWNAQISLLTGIAAASIMLDGGVGLLRTLPPANEEVIDGIRRTARALDVEWPRDMSYADRVRDLDPLDPAEAALLTRSARSLRGASYAAFSGEPPEQPLHAAIASTYAHVTAPLRRVCDRFTNEIIVALCDDREPPAWAVDRLPDLPEIMNKARQRDRSLERTIVDYVEVMCLQDRIGQVFDGVVLSRNRNNSTIQLRDPAVMSFIDDDTLEVGSAVRLQLERVDLERRRLYFEVAE